MDEAHNPQEPVVSVLLRNQRRFLAFLEARIGNRHDAEEILQNALVKSIQKGDGLRQAENVVAWFYRLLRNAVVDHFRHRSAGQRAVEALQAAATDDLSSLEQETERVVCDCVNDLIPMLKPEQAELIRLVELQGMAVNEAARVQGVTAGNARVRLHRAREALRQGLEQTCRTCAKHGCLDCTCSRTPGPNGP